MDDLQIHWCNPFNSLTMKLRLRFRTFLRTLIVLLSLSVILVTLASLFLPQIAALVLGIPLPGPTPPPPAINAPRGEMPAGPGGLKEFRRPSGKEYELVGSGFFLRLADDAVVGLTTAHSVPSLGSASEPLERIAFRLPGGQGFVAEFDTLYGLPGVPRTGGDLTVDYVLLKVDGPIDANLALTPDPRGAPQPGERVRIMGGLGELNKGQRLFSGTVLRVNAHGVWVLMDDNFEPGEMSGSPFVSEYTGQVVGMAIAVAHEGDRILIGVNPIAHILQVAEAAKEFPKIAEYRR
jgi:trypsin-like peptidase